MALAHTQKGKKAKTTASLAVASRGKVINTGFKGKYRENSIDT